MRVLLSVSAALTMFVGRANAAPPLLELQPLTAVTITVATGETATVQYMVTNHATTAKTWELTAIAGVTQITSGAGLCAQPFVLAASASCVLSLQIAADDVQEDGIQGGPLVCVSGSPLQCYQPAVADALNVTIVATPCEFDSDCSSEHYCRDGACTHRLPSGESCASPNECSSGHCVDAVCCATACDGGDHDCQACAIAAGAAIDGTCAPIADASVCDDGDGCSLTDACVAGVCGGESDACHDGTSCVSTSSATYACGVCPAGTHSTDGTGATACVACEARAFASTAGATSCVLFTTCGRDEVVASEGSATQDRACAPREAGGDPDGGAGDPETPSADDEPATSDGGGCSASGRVGLVGSPTSAWLATIGCAWALGRRRQKTQRQ